VANQVIQRAALTLHGQPRVLHVALDYAPLLQHPADAGGDLLHQFMQLGACRSRHMPKHRRRPFRRQIHPIQEDHVKVDVQVQRRTEALDQRHGAGEPRGAGEASLLQQEAGDGAVDCAQNPRQ